MNYFAHGRAYVADPGFLAGTALPDWMNVVDRRNRVRSRAVVLYVDDADAVVARLAAGVLQHHVDDAWFHETRAFAELSLDFACRVRDALAGDDGFRPHFLGHILVEILLDAHLIDADPDQLRAYYAALNSLDAAELARAINRITPRPVENFPWFLRRFSDEGFLWDYGDDGKLMFRLNQVMRRVGLPPLPDALRAVLPGMRDVVAARHQELLSRPDELPRTSDTTASATSSFSSRSA